MIILEVLGSLLKWVCTEVLLMSWGCQKYVCDHSMGLFDINCMCLLCLQFHLNFSMNFRKLQTHDICFWTFLFSYELIHWDASKPRNGLIEAPKV
jgi:hypothetical protein